MTNRFACEFKSRLEQMQPIPDIQLVAVAAVSGPLVNGTENEDEQTFSCDNVTMPILHIHGTADPIVPFGGCNSTWSSYKEDCPSLHHLAKFAPFPDVDDYISDWRMRNGVHESREQVTYQNNSVSCSSWGSDPLQNVTLCVATGKLRHCNTHLTPRSHCTVLCIYYVPQQVRGMLGLATTNFVNSACSSARWTWTRRQRSYGFSKIRWLRDGERGGSAAAAGAATNRWRQSGRRGPGLFHMGFPCRKCTCIHAAHAGPPPARQLRCKDRACTATGRDPGQY
jgi:hypothetical protein